MADRQTTAERLAETIMVALDLGLQAWRKTGSRERFIEAHDAVDALVADLAAALATVEQMREALREEVKKRHHYTDGSQPDDAWLDAKIAEMYPALAAVPDPEEPRANELGWNRRTGRYDRR